MKLVLKFTLETMGEILYQNLFPERDDMEKNSSEPYFNKAPIFNFV